MSRETITIAGFTFNVTPVYSEGHTLTENEASALNQMRAENLRNNFASKVKEAKNEAGEIAEDKLAELQSAFDEYASTYQFGIRALGGGSAAARRDPVESEARRMVLAAIKANLKAAGRSIDSVDPEKLELKVVELLEAPFDEAGRTFMEVARERVALKQATTKAAFDTSDLGEAPAPVEGEAETAAPKQRKRKAAA